MVSAWVNERNLTLGQLATETHSNGACWSNRHGGPIGMADWTWRFGLAKTSTPSICDRRLFLALGLSRSHKTVSARICSRPLPATDQIPIPKAVHAGPIGMADWTWRFAPQTSTPPICDRRLFSALGLSRSCKTLAARICPRPLPTTDQIPIPKAVHAGPIGMADWTWRFAPQTSTPPVCDRRLFLALGLSRSCKTVAARICPRPLPTTDQTPAPKAVRVVAPRKHRFPPNPPNKAGGQWSS